DPALGACGLALMGQAYQELGMVDPMVKLCEKARRRARGALAERLALALAEAYHAAGQDDRARPLYQELAAGRGGPCAAPARLRLAEIALQEKNAPDCLRWCRLLLHDREGPGAAPVLKLMAGA